MLLLNRLHVSETGLLHNCQGIPCKHSQPFFHIINSLFQMPLTPKILYILLLAIGRKM